MMIPRLTTQFSVFIPDFPEALSQVARILAGEGINLTAAMSGGMVDGAALRFVTDHPGGVRERLEEAGCALKVEHVCCVELPDRPGELDRLTRTLAEEDIEVRNVYGTGGGGEKAKVVLSVDDPKRAVFILLRRQFTGAAQPA